MILVIILVLLSLVSRCDAVDNTPVVDNSSLLYEKALEFGGLTIGTINMAGFFGRNKETSKTIQFSEWIEERNIDICIVTETHAKHNADLPQLENFTWTSTCGYTTNENAKRFRGGVALLIKNNIGIVKSVEGKDALQGRAIRTRIILNNNEYSDKSKRVWICGIYAPVYQQQQARFYEQLLLWKPNSKWIVWGGDFNSSLNCFIADGSHLQRDNDFQKWVWKSELNDINYITDDGNNVSFIREKIKVQNRIDYILTSSGIESVGFVDTIVAPAEDGHLGLVACIRMPAVMNVHRESYFHSRPSFVRIDAKDKKKIEKFKERMSIWKMNLPFEYSRYIYDQFLIPREHWPDILQRIAQLTKEEIANIFEIRKWKRPRDEQLGKAIQKVVWAGKAMRAAHLIILEQKGVRAMNYRERTHQQRVIVVPEDIEFETLTNPTNEGENFDWRAKLQQQRRIWKKEEWKEQKRYNQELRIERIKKIKEECHKNSSLFRKLYYSNQQYTMNNNRNPTILLDNNNSWKLDSEDRKEYLAQYMESLCEVDYVPDRSWNHARKLRKLYCGRNLDSSCLDDIPLDLFRKILRKTRSSSAPGLDGIQYAALKLLDEDCTNLLYNLIRSIIYEEVLPEELQTGEVVFLFKDGSPYRLSNYRGITLLSVIYKLITSIMREKLMEFAPTVLETNHGGGLSGRSTHDRVAVVDLLLNNAIRMKKSLFIFASDCTKAYDRVFLPGFIEALRWHGIDEKFCRLYELLINNSFVRIRSNDGPSRLVRILRGCKQGCGLSPLIFVFLMDLFISWINEQNLGYHARLEHEDKQITILDREGVLVAAIAFIDDITLFADNEDTMKAMITKFGEFLYCYGLELNESKSKIVKWGENSIDSYNISANVPKTNRAGETTLVTRNFGGNPDGSIKILGFVFSKDGKWLLHWKMLESKLINRAKKIANGINDIYVRSSLIASDLNGIFNYYAPVIGDPDNDKKIDKIQKDCFAIILKSFRLGMRAPARYMELESMLGYRNWCLVSKAKSVELLMKSFNSPDSHLRKLALMTLVDIARTNNIYVLRNWSIRESELVGLERFSRWIHSALATCGSCDIKLDISDDLIRYSWSIDWHDLSEIAGIYGNEYNILRSWGNELLEMLVIWKRDDRNLSWNRWRNKLPTYLLNQQLRTKITNICDRVSSFVEDNIQLFSAPSHINRVESDTNDQFWRLQLSDPSLAGELPWLGTDGSVKSGHGGSSIVDLNGNAIQFRCGGHTTSLMAEMLAILVAVSASREWIETLILTDCANAIKLLDDFVWGNREITINIPCKAIIKKMRQLVGNRTIRISKVESHISNRKRSKEEDLNEKADSLAKEARVSSELVFEYNKLDSYYRNNIIIRDTIFESNISNWIYKRLKTEKITDFFRKNNDSILRERVCQRSSFQSIYTKTPNNIKVFALRVRWNNLPSLRKIYNWNRNKKDIPTEWPICPLCSLGVMESTHHCFAECSNSKPLREDIRKTALASIPVISTSNNNNNSSYQRLQIILKINKWITTISEEKLSKARWYRGENEREILTIVQNKQASQDILGWLRKINLMFIEKCYEYWLQRCKLMEQKKRMYNDLDDWIERFRSLEEGVVDDTETRAEHEEEEEEEEEE